MDTKLHLIGTRCFGVPLTNGVTLDYDNVPIHQTELNEPMRVD